jgi:tRNA (cmo5U34)-methyltransferase
MQLYDEQWAQRYDDMAKASLPGYEAIHRLVTAVFLSRLPDEANILVVGAGTGTEILHLGSKKSAWRFVAIEPAEAMMAACQHRVAQAGLGDRVIFHPGLLDTLRSQESFDGATSILVSHHIMEEQQRIDFFRQIANRLKPGASFVTADLFGDLTSEEFQLLQPIWRQQGISSGLPESALDTGVEKFGKELALAPESRIDDYLQQAGFAAPTLIFRSLMYGAWLTRFARPH